MVLAEGARTRVVWAPPATRRLQAVRSEIGTMAELAIARHLTRSERSYQEHLVRREQELLEELAEEVRKLQAEHEKRFGNR